MRLIDADALKRRADEVTFMGFQAVERKKHFMDLVSAMAKSCPTIDAVPVVRCKDCIHWLNEDGLDDHVCLKIYSDGAVSCYAWQPREPDDFCSYGERRGDGNAY